jgi:hypothetical protein
MFSLELLEYHVLKWFIRTSIYVLIAMEELLPVV